ncbi:MAG: Ig domain-containing protein [Prevotella sp.]|nr:Ig domain-containing protein [Prevotella sp.]MBQ8115541.1 Ig domain-containing protein [Prevotella sp.]
MERRKQTTLKVLATLMMLIMGTTIAPAQPGGSAVLNYTINAVDGSDNILKVIATGTSTGTGQTMVAIPQYVRVESTNTLYETAPVQNGNPYAVYFTPDQDNYVVNRPYTMSTTSNVVFYDEAENILSKVQSGGGANEPKLSCHKLGYTNSSTSYELITSLTLEPGTYYIYARGINGNATAKTVNFKLGSSSAPSDDAAVHTFTIPANNNGTTSTSSAITIDATSKLWVAADGSQASGLDWIYIVKQPDTSLSDVVARGRRLTDGGNGSYAYSIGMSYNQNTVSVDITPNSSTAVVSGGGVTGTAGQTTTFTATIGTTLTVTVTDGSETTDYTISVTRAADIAITDNKYTIENRTYYEGQRFIGDNITAWIPTTAGNINQWDLRARTWSETLTGAQGTEYNRSLLMANGSAPTYNSTTGVPTGGFYYAFIPRLSGVLEVAMLLNQQKTLYISDGTKLLTYGTDYTTSIGTNTTTEISRLYATIPVISGTTYYLYAPASKPELAGFHLYGQEMTGLTISGPTEVAAASTITLTANPIPANTTINTVSWTSSDETIATVNQLTGVVTGIKAGNVTITATAIDNSGLTATYDIEIVKRPFTYTVNAIDGSGNILKQITTGTYQYGDGTPATVYYPQYIKVDNALYEVEREYVPTGATSAGYYAINITPDSENATYNVSYNYSIKDNVVFYTEAEDMTEVFDEIYAGGNTKIRKSGGLSAHSSTADYKKLTTLSPGTYKIDITGIVENKNITAHIYFKIDETTVFDADFSTGESGGNNFCAATSAYFTLSEAKDLYVSTQMVAKSGVDLIYITQYPVYHVTTDQQQFNFTKENIDGTVYTTANPVNSKGSNGTHNGVTGAFYNIKWESNYVTITFDGAIAFSIDAFHGNSKETRDVNVYLDDAELTPFHVVPSNYTTSPIYSTGGIGTHTVKITGAGKDVYPADIVFYTTEQEPKLDYTSAAVKVGETKNITLKLPYGCTFGSMTDSGDASKVTASFVRDDSAESAGRKGTLTLTGIAPTGDTPTTLTFSITSNNTDVFLNGSANVTIEVLKSALTLSYSDGDSDDDATEYVCNADETTPSLPTITLSAVDEYGTIVELSNLNITYTSDDNTVATVSDAGAITLTTPHGNGTAVIKATATSDKYDDAEAEYKITIQRGVNWKVATHPVFKSNPPGVRDTFHVSKYIGDEETLYLVGTFGGWNRNNNKYDYPVNKDSVKTKTDSWKKITNSGTGIDGFSKYSSGAQDACDETMYSSLDRYYNSVIYGTERFGWFKQPDGDTSYPFTLPVRGTYITLEPEVNGTLSVYIEQNGPWNTGKSDVYDNDGNLVSVNSDSVATTFPGSVPFQYRPHALFIVDQNGNQVDKHTDVNITTRTKVTTGLSTDDNEVLKNFCDKYACEKGEKFKCIIDEDADGYNDVTNIGNWKEFKEYMSLEEQREVHKNWSAGVNGAQVITKLDNGAYLALQGGMVKYTFHVIAGQTYYIFSNFSKIGFSGVNFVPDDDNQPSGTLELSEDAAYNPKSLKSGDTVNTIPMYETITLDRSFTANKWNTICLPFTMTEREVENVFGNGTELIILDKVSVDEGHASIFMKYHEIQNILAGYPYLIKPTQDVDSIKVHNKGIDPAQQVMEFTNNGYTSKGVTGFCTPQTFNIKGTDYSASVLLNTGDIFLSGNTLYLSRGTSMLKGYRSYLKKEDDGSAPAKSVSFNYFKAWEDEEEATAINVCEMSDEALDSFETKTMNGVFSVTGQKVSNTLNGLTKGIYIFNGRKVIVK